MSHVPRVVALVILLALVAPWPPAIVAAAVPAVPVVNAAAPESGAKVNVNTAGVKELMTLAGVGRGLAEKIVQYRDAHGLFKKPADLRKVDGVGDALWERNRARIVVK